MQIQFWKFFKNEKKGRKNKLLLAKPKIIIVYHHQS